MVVGGNVGYLVTEPQDSSPEDHNSRKGRIVEIESLHADESTLLLIAPVWWDPKLNPVWDIEYVHTIVLQRHAK